jgi:hypothetical protein
MALKSAINGANCYRHAGAILNSHDTARDATFPATRSAARAASDKMARGMRYPDVDLAKLVPVPGFSWVVVLVLVVVIGLSVGVFVVLVRRWTSKRSWVEITDWARERGFRVSARETAAPGPLARVQRADLRAAICASNKQTTLVQLEAVPPAGADVTMNVTPTRWHALVRTIESSWQPTGLRPATAAASLLDLYSLSSFPLMGETRRFVVYGTDSAPARRVSKSNLRGLLPPDIGLLLHGQHMVLDFSTRPFDAIEFDRMIALADQLVLHLPSAS